ncbi:hypothetical protein [Glycomyces sp. NPDC047010]|uniref:hypothetical protein n=1 Tax=Glycomyces sp. NPDC047010 TaxID=3155023 RepID=UPI0033D070DA
MTPLGPEVGPHSTTTVTIGDGDRERVLALKVFASSGLATVSASEDAPEFLGTVTGLNTREGHFKPKAVVAGEFTQIECTALCQAADAAYQAAQANLRAASLVDPAGPPILAPRAGSTYLTVDGLKIAFTPDTGNGSVSLHTGTGSPRNIGQVRSLGGAGDAQAVLWLAGYWGFRFGGDDLSRELKEAAGNIWRAARDATTPSEVQHG